MGASTAPLPDDIEGLRAQNRAYRSLCASLEAAQAIQTEHGRKSHEAITTLDSERDANARLTEEAERLQRERDYAVRWANQSVAMLQASFFPLADALRSLEAYLRNTPHHNVMEAAAARKALAVFDNVEITPLSHPHSGGKDGTPTPKEGE